MNDDLCGIIGSLRQYLPDDVTQTSSLDFYSNSKFVKYCPDKNCNSDLDKITIGFLWLLEQYFSKYPKKGKIVNDIKPFFLYIILWLSYKLNQNSEHKTTQINDFYNKHVKNSDKYKKFISDAYTYTDLEDALNKKNDLLKINIKDLSKFYDASKLICSMYGNLETNTNSNILSDNATSFVNEYAELKDDSNIEDTLHGQILSDLSTDYDNIKDKCKNTQSLPEITSNMYAQTSRVTSSSSIGNRLFTVLSIFGAIAFFLGISYKVNNKELKNYFHYIYPNVNKKNIYFLTFYISIHYLDFGNELKNNI
ncbi:putative yir3 protein [Plasmodium yoelii yoelii]|uniref:Yir3 protein n=1 Tax=Plasmodium yoelii yoelii TaxID=73239 RepID=Q7RLM3_PLAYO|nr:putative yir3 protein [Plasmodium yoelii yoelii]